jgi:hypothetical protein
MNDRPQQPACIPAPLGLIEPHAGLLTAPPEGQLLYKLMALLPSAWGSTMNYLLSILITAVIVSQAMMWHSLATIRDAIQQTNAIPSAACGSDERPCQVAAHKGQIRLGEVMVYSRVSDGLSCAYSSL